MIARPNITRRVRILFAVGGIACLGSIVGAFIILTFNVSHLSGHLTAQSDRTAALTRRVSNDLESSTVNREANVRRWCTAINTDRRVTVAYVNAEATLSPGLPLLRLAQLPCHQLEMATVASISSKKGSHDG
jgi:hypothetical protein